MIKNIKVLFISALLILSIVGCSSQDTQSESSSQTVVATPQAAGSVSGSISSEAPTSSEASSINSEANSSSAESNADDNNSESEAAEPIASSSEATAPAAAADALTVHFGDDGAPFTMQIYDNSTAAAIADYVGTADWRLPIYNYDGYDNWEVMQYYELPSRYEIPSNPETVTSQKAGEVYYSDPNRIVLFYQDGEVTGEYTRVGYFDATADFVSAVSDNPVLEGWGNKIVLIKD